LRRGCGFTLVELLVVVAIISLLVTIVLPSLQNAQVISRRTVCLTNLHQIGAGFFLYERDAGRFPTAAYMPAPFGWKQFPPTDAAPLYAVLTAGGGIPIDSGVYRCPGDKVKDLVYAKCGISYFFDPVAAPETYQDLSASRPMLWDCDDTDLMTLNGAPVDLPDFHGMRAVLFADGHTGKQASTVLGWGFSPVD